ncbi:twin-arginine translocase TatA/TatE family subunit [Chloroflexota bacterium]
MGFLGIGSWEILLILVLALIILGPGKLTDFARILGKTMRAVKKASFDLTQAVTKELEVIKNEPPASQSQKDSSIKPEEAPPAIKETNAPSQDNQPAKPGEASSTK